MSLSAASALIVVEDGDSTTKICSNPRIRSKEDLKNMPGGRPKSGRVWKNKKERYSNFRLPKAVKKSFEKHKEEREEKRATKLYEREIKARRAEEQEEKRKRAEEKKQKKLENERKSEIVQEIKNTAKLKGMKKKQLRLIEKR